MQSQVRPMVKPRIITYKDVYNCTATATVTILGSLSAPTIKINGTATSLGVCTGASSPSIVFTNFNPVNTTRSTTISTGAHSQKISVTGI
jgi:hypothetical protein